MKQEFNTIHKIEDWYHDKLYKIVHCYYCNGTGCSNNPDNFCYSCGGVGYDWMKRRGVNERVLKKKKKKLLEEADE